MTYTCRNCGASNGYSLFQQAGPLKCRYCRSFKENEPSNPEPGEITAIRSYGNSWGYSFPPLLLPW